MASRAASLTTPSWRAVPRRRAKAMSRLNMEITILGSMSDPDQFRHFRPIEDAKTASVFAFPRHRILWHASYSLYGRAYLPRSGNIPNPNPFTPRAPHAVLPPETCKEPRGRDSRVRRETIQTLLMQLARHLYKLTKEPLTTLRSAESIHWSKSKSKQNSTTCP
jgi:hypothetical protein